MDCRSSSSRSNHALFELIVDDHANLSSSTSASIARLYLIPFQ